MPKANKYSTAKDLAKSLAKKTGLKRDAAKIFVDAYFDIIKQELLANNRIFLSGFGSFESTKWKTDSIYNINTKTKTARSIKTAAFKVSETIKQKIT